MTCGVCVCVCVCVCVVNVAVDLGSVPRQGPRHQGQEGGTGGERSEEGSRAQEWRADNRRVHLYYKREE